MELVSKKEYIMSHTFTLESLRLKGYRSNDDELHQATATYLIDDDQFLTTEVGSNMGEAVANLCIKICNRRGVPMATIVPVILTAAVEAITETEAGDTSGEFPDDLPF